MSFEAESNSELTVIVPAYQLHFQFPMQNKIHKQKILSDTRTGILCSMYCRSLWFSARSVRRISKSLAYLSLFRPKLEYACSVWDPHTGVHRHKIEMFQRQAARYACNRYHKYWEHQDVKFEYKSSIQNKENTGNHTKISCITEEVEVDIVAESHRTHMT
jgi:hypothetical protein